MSKTVEEWRPIVGYEGLYEVSDWGNVKNNKNRFLAKDKSKCGYLMVDLWKNGEMKHFSVHRLVAEAFIPNPQNKPQVGHSDCNRTNNRVENLYWCTQLENMNNLITKENQSKAQKGRQFSEQHKKNLSESLKKSERLHKLMKSPEYLEKLSKAHKGKMLNRKDMSREVKQFTMGGEFIACYPSAKEAARQTGFAQTNISRCCNGGYLHKGKWVNIHQVYGFKWTY